MPTSKLIVFCYLPGSAQAVPAGQFEHDDQMNIGMFQYGRRYQERANAMALDPVTLPLGPAIQPVETNGGLYGAFRDAAPDYWGRLVIASRMKRPPEALTEIDFLVHANATRVGNLDFRESPDSPEPPLAPPQFQNIGMLIEAAQELEQGHEIDDRSRLLLEQGSSLGGARPKCTAELDGEQWLAKFPSRNDRINIPRIEYATMTLAKACGLQTPELKLQQVAGKDVFLIHRFDRVPTGSGNWFRQGFASALSLAGWDERDHTRWSYRTVAERIRRHSIHPAEDLNELFRRIAFNILVRNTDDHPRNHGFLYEEQGVSLSPLYDVVPSITPRGVGSEFFLAMNIGEEGRLASLKNLCSSAPAFNLKTTEAKELTDALREQVSDTWRDHFSEHGFSEQEIKLLAPSFGQG